jgi:hypothetical protein
MVHKREKADIEIKLSVSDLKEIQEGYSDIISVKDVTGKKTVDIVLPEEYEEEES